MITAHPKVHFMLAPPPFIFNARKHHAGALYDFIQGYDRPLENLHLEVRTIGSALMDLYYGPLSVQQICTETTLILQDADLWEKQNFQSWLNTNSGFRALTLSDDSTWVLRWGEDPKRHIHVHPARYSSTTMRIKAGTLMTAIGIAIYCKKNPGPAIDRTALNRIRSIYLKLSPVKSGQLNERLLQLLEIWNCPVKPA